MYTLGFLKKSYVSSEICEFSKENAFLFARRLKEFGVCSFRKDLEIQQNSSPSVILQQREGTWDHV